MARLASLLALVIAAQAAAGPLARAGEIGADPIEVRRGLAAVGPSASDEPALRLERRTREPSAGFVLGAALGAWISAAAALDYDLKTPSGDGGDAEAIEQDCYDERTAFAHLEARWQALGITPRQAAAAAGVAVPALLPAWTLRQAGPSQRCR